MAFSLNASIPMSGVPAIPDIADTMGQAVNLANAFDARRQNQAAIGRQQQVRNVFANSPTGQPDYQKVAAIDPEMAMKMQDLAAQAAQRQAESQRWMAQSRMNDEKVQMSQQQLAVEHHAAQLAHGLGFLSPMLQDINTPGYATNPIAKQYVHDQWQKNAPALSKEGGLSEFADINPDSPDFEKQVNDVYNRLNTENNNLGQHFTAYTKAQTDLQALGIKGAQETALQNQKNAGALAAAHVKNQKPVATPGAGGQDKEQNLLYQQGLSQITSLRGDRSLQAVEAQRDGAIDAMKTIQRAEKSGQPMNSFDMINVLSKINEGKGEGKIPQTLAGNVGKAFQLVTGQPAPSTTIGIQNALKALVTQIGSDADQKHAAYMAPHLAFNPGLTPENQARLSGLARGLNYAQATAPALKTATPEEAAKLPSGTHFLTTDGIEHVRK
jgi:hypothetical protein